MSIESNIRAYAKRCVEKQVEPEPAQGHTPGPWRTFTRYVLANGRFLATAHAIGDISSSSKGFALGQEPAQDMNEAEANARLIAAAPDLLAACKMSLLRFGAMEQMGQKLHPFVYETVAALKDAIAKTTNEGRAQ